MNKIRILFVFAIFVIFISTVKGADITSCGILNETDGFYNLTQDILNSSENICLHIQANNITLNCQNYLVEGNYTEGVNASDTIGIYNEGYNYTKIENCIVQNWGTGIFLINSSYNEIRNVTSNNNHGTGEEGEISGMGILFWDSSYNNLIDITARYNDIGIGFNATYSNIMNSTTEYNAFGLGIVNDFNTLENVVSNFNLIGAMIMASNNTLINITLNSNYQMDGNGGIGIAFQNSFNNTLKNSIVQNNTVAGLYLANASHDVFYNNLFNNSNNVVFNEQTYQTYWNTTRQSGQRIYSNGTEIGGNYWTNETGDGFSDTCSDSNSDGFCDGNYSLLTDVKDYLPLSNKYGMPLPPYVVPQPISNTSCVDNSTLMIYEFISEVIQNGSSTYYQNKTKLQFTHCDYGCDFFRNQCNEAPWIRNIWIIGILLVAIVIIIVLTKAGGYW